MLNIISIINNSNPIKATNSLVTESRFLALWSRPIQISVNRVNSLTRSFPDYVVDMGVLILVA